MSVQVESAVSPNFAEFLLDSAENGNEIAISIALEMGDVIPDVVY